MKQSGQELDIHLKELEKKSVLKFIEENESECRYIIQIHSALQNDLRNYIESESQLEFTNEIKNQIVETLDSLFPVYQEYEDIIKKTQFIIILNI
jgi:hypothetical protein